MFSAEFYFSKFNNAFSLNDDFEQWYKEINMVTPGKIRIESDELHYCLHIILRFEIENELIEGKINVKEIPKIWNRRMKEYFGVVPKDMREGALQDVHWSNGYFGYFPSYAIGTIYATSIYNAIKRDIPEVEKEISLGKYEKIIKWLKEKIHSQGNLYSGEELIYRACGKKLDIKEYIEYLSKKYYSLYQIKEVY
ncbi:MAG: carboxypeptidase [Candidatus Pacearchaeota archaeon]